jgi:hypothetical protein
MPSNPSLMDSVSNFALSPVRALLASASAAVR